MARTRKGQVITLKQAIMHEKFKDCAVGGEWVVLSGGKTTVAAPVAQYDAETRDTNALRLEEKQVDQYFDLTDRKGELPTGYVTTYHLAYQWNEVIRSMTQ